MKRWSRYRAWSTSMLRVWLSVFGQPILRDVFVVQVGEVESELLARELPSIADESGGFLVAAPGGMH